MWKIPAFLVCFCPILLADIQVFETADTKVTVEITSADNINIIDFTAIPAIQNGDAITLWISLTDKTTGQELDMPISLSDFKKFVSEKGTSWAGNLVQRSIALFKTLFQDCKVKRLSLLENPKPLKKKIIKDAGKE